MRFEIRTDPDRSSEACGIVDYCSVSQGDHNTNPRDCHQPPSNLIVPGSGKHLPIEHRHLVANGVPDRKQRLDNRDQCRIAGNLLTNAHRKQAFAAPCDNQAKGLEQPADRVSRCLALRHQAGSGH
jgi:hypothetical protein